MRWLATVAVVLASALGAGCGDDDPARLRPGQLAERVPASADIYIEMVVRPQGDLEASLSSAAESFGFDLDDLAPGGAGGVAPVADLAGLEQDIDYEDDVKPWLGERMASFSILADEAEIRAARIAPGEFGEGASFDARVVAVDDADEAQGSLEEILGEGTDPPAGVEARFWQEGDPTIALTDDALLIGAERAVEAAAAATPDGSLASESWFAAPSRTALGSIVAKAETLMGLSLLSEAPGLERQLDATEVTRRANLEPGEAITVELGVADGAPVLDVTAATVQPARIAAAAELAGDLPAESWLAVADPLSVQSTLEMFRTGVELGLEQRTPGQTAAEASAGLFLEYGYDPLRSIDAIRDEVAIFAAGSDPTSVGALVRVDDERGVFAVDGLRFVIGTAWRRSGIDAVQIPDHPYSFTFEIPRLTGGLVAGQRDGRLALAPGETAADLAAVDDPPRTLSQTDRLDSVASRLGAGWTALGFVELDRAFSALIAAQPELLLRLPQVVQLDLEDRVLDAGATYRDGRYVQRIQLSPAD